MDVWGWIALYAIGLTLLQLLVYRYLLSSRGSLTRRVGSPFGDHEGERDTTWADSSSRPSSNPGSSHPPRDHENAGGRGSSTPSSASSPHGLDTWAQVTASPTSDGPSSPHPAATDGRLCRHCGVVNEADTTFTRCWNCTHEL